MAQNPINDELLEDLLEYNNKMTCVRDTMSSIQQSDLMIVNNIENGKSNDELIQPFLTLFRISELKPHCDVNYVQQKRDELSVNIGSNCNDVNVYDLETFLQAIVPRQTALLNLLEKQCNKNPQFLDVVDSLHLLRTACSRAYCQGKILSSAKFARYSDESDTINFCIAHPPFVYEGHRIFNDCSSNVENYLLNLRHYLTNPIENDSCLLCIAYDLYCKNAAEKMKNFRLFFLENVHSETNGFGIQSLYDTNLGLNNHIEQCSVFDTVLHRISIIIEGSSPDFTYVVRYFNEKKQEVKLYF